MGRIVGDGAINFDIVDVAVDPAHQWKRPWPAGDGEAGRPGWTLTPLMAPTLRWWRMCRNCTRSSASKAFARRARGWPASGEPAVVSSHFLPRKRALSKWQLVLRRVPHYAERHSHREDPMTRFSSLQLCPRFCSTPPASICIWSACRVLLRTSGGQRGAITYRLLGLSGRYGLRDAVCWPHRRPLGA